MAQRDDQDFCAESENARAGPLFIQKQPLDEDEQKEMMEQVKSMKTTCRAVNEMWEAMSKVFSRRGEICNARSEAYLRQAKEKQVDYINVTPGRTRRSKAFTIADSGLDEDTAKHYYETWSKDLKKNIEQQRRKTRQSVEKWFRYLHKFDGVEQKPSNRIISGKLICFGLVIILCALHTILSFQPEYTEKCTVEPLSCFREKILEGLVGAYNFYLTVHNITIDYTGDS